MLHPRQHEHSGSCQAPAWNQEYNQSLRKGSIALARDSDCIMDTSAFELETCPLGYMLKQLTKRLKHCFETDIVPWNVFFVVIKFIYQN